VAVERLLADPDVQGLLPDADGSALVGAAERGDAELVARLLDAGLPIGALGGNDGATALHAAAIAGSGFQPDTAPDPDWIATIQALLDAGADTSDVALSPDDQKPPSDEVAAFLRATGVVG
jgi:ankyrin repeat protein